MVGFGCVGMDYTGFSINDLFETFDFAGLKGILNGELFYLIEP
jgi:hypothetical protein